MVKLRHLNNRNDPVPKLLPVLLALLMVGCSQFPGVYKIPVEQGNQLSQQNVDALELGMTREQVRFLIGTPVFVNRLQNDRWIYARRQTVGDQLTESSKLEIRFTDGVVTAITPAQ